MNKVSGHYFSCILGECESLGLSKDAIFSKFDLSTIDFQDPLQRLDEHHLVNLYDMASTQLDEPNIGLKVGKRFNVSWLNETGKLLPVCATLGEAGLALGRYHRLTQSFGKSQLQMNGASAILEWYSHYDDFEEYKHAIEAIFTGVIIAAKWLLLNEGTPIEYVHFRHAAHGDVASYEDILGCPVYFDQNIDAIGINSAYLNLPLATKNAEMKVEISRNLDRFMLRLNDENSLIERVEASIREQLHEGSPRFSVTAYHLSFKKRTLRSKLKRQSVSFREIVTRVRQAICEVEMRKNTQISLIAQKLGFHDQSAFNHAFHDWYGMAPREYQASHSAALGAK